MKIISSLNKTSKNKNHHLCRIGKIWWVYYTQEMPDSSFKKVRINLMTSDLEIARMHRDMILHDQNIIRLD
jgi:hypothetical protein